MENSVCLLILADDLTGALDTGVQFAKRGTDVRVYPSFDDAVQDLRETGADTAANSQADVRVVNTDTRHVPAEEARKAVTAAVSAFRNCTHFYKKTDSCLRGNIGAELEALMKATGCSLLPFIPAHPALKRTTRSGYQYLDGVLLHQSPMARDPLNPVTDSFIPSTIGKQSRIPVRLVGTDLRGTDLRETEPRGTDPAGTEHLLIFDGETSAHLEAAARALQDKGLLRVSAGCAGFAEALMEALPFGQENKRTDAVVHVDRLPILVVTGSLNPVSIGQVEAARERNIPCFCVAEDDLLAEGWFESERERSLAADCRRQLQQRGMAVLGTDLAVGIHAVSIHADSKPTMGTDPLGINADGKTRQPVSDNSQQISCQVAVGKIADCLGKITQSILNESGPLHLVVFGGDTLLGIMNTLGYRHLRPLKEIFPGVVLAKKGNSYLVTKSGAFGDRGLISEIEEFFNDLQLSDNRIK
ncbi:MAG: four-carbon acid sugar kinase family protein [Treponema sp.]|jgi:uncharacterized protein YgbK (DUF1537 family)|nr:four-carbon acid sugar kinase family protein [Treponema sp.]